MTADDLAELRALSVGYAVAADERDGEAFAALFTDDARLTSWKADGEGNAPFHGPERLATIPGLLARYDRTLHHVTSHLVRPDPDAADDADRAAGVTYCEAHHVTGTEDKVLAIRYDDRYRRGPDGRWRIAERDVRIQWTEHRTVSR